MGLIDTITEHDNKYWEDLEKCSKSGYKTYILGNGEGAQHAEKRANGFKFAGRIVDREFYDEEQDDLFCVEDIFCQMDEKINIVIACYQYDMKKLYSYADKINMIVERDCFGGYCYKDEDLISYDWVLQNQDRLNTCYNDLADEKSKAVYSAYINQRISMDYSWLDDVLEDDQKIRFFSDVVTIKDNEVYVDCGAYDGDSARDFVKVVNMAGKEYDKIISFEPDIDNYQLLKNSHINRHICHNIALGAKDDLMVFMNSKTTSSRLINKNESTAVDSYVKIPVKRLDDVISDVITKLKVDVNGYELDCLLGGG